MIRLTVVFKGEEVSLYTLAARTGLVYSTLYGRWKRAGYPHVVDESLVITSRFSATKQRIVIDGKEYSSSEKVAHKFHLSKRFVQERFRELGTRQTTSEELTAPKVKVRKPPTAHAIHRVIFEPHGEVTFQQIAHDILADMSKSQHFFRNRWKGAGRPKTVTLEMFKEKSKYRTPGCSTACNSREQLAIYSDPNYLPGIPWGDLEGLSNTENTGAGRGEIDNPTSFRTSALGNVIGLSARRNGTSSMAHIEGRFRG
jgi:hypothetical protein